MYTAEEFRQDVIANIKGNNVKTGIRTKVTSVKHTNKGKMPIVRRKVCQHSVSSFLKSGRTFVF